MRKKYLLTLLLAFFSYLSAMAAVSLEEAKTKVKDYVENTLMLDKYELFFNTSNISKVEILFDNSVSVPASSWVFFLDEQPTANWSHDASVIFVAKSSGNITRKKVSFFPKNISSWSKDLSQKKDLKRNNSFEENASIPDHLTFDSDGLLRPNQFSKTSRKCNNAYALIISGGIIPEKNYSRYWNDCSLIYQILVDIYGYDRNKIYVLMADGTSTEKDLYLLTKYKYISSPLDLNGDGTYDIQRSATKDNISWAFDQLASKMTSNDNLFIFTTDHGSRYNGLCLWDEQNLTTSQMLEQVRKLNNYNSISICMEQCYSGAFVNSLSNIDRLTICTAANATETSCGGTYGSYIDEYAYHWAMAMAQKESADTDNDTNISMLEAYKYAKNADGCSEHPQYWSDGCDGERLYLNGPLVDTKTLCCTLSSNALRKATSRITSTTKITRAKVDYQTYGNIILKSGFKVSDGAKFKGTILACRSSNTNGSLRSADIFDDFDYEEFEINPEITEIDDAVSEASGIEIYPNPTDGLLYINSSSTINKVIVADMTGKIIMDVNGGSDKVELDLSSNPKGIYVLKVISEDDSIVEKIVLE